MDIRKMLTERFGSFSDDDPIIEALNDRDRLREAAVRLAFAVARKHGLTAELYDMADRVRITAGALQDEAAALSATEPSGERGGLREAARKVVEFDGPPVPMRLAILITKLEAALDTGEPDR